MRPGGTAAEAPPRRSRSTLYRRAGVGLLATVLVCGLLPAAPALAAPAGAAGTPDRTITLITGDRVVLATGGDRTNTAGPHSVQPGQGRSHIRFLTQRVDGRLHVFPADALPLLRSGRLDSRLFDVTTLLEFGYDDRRGDTPLIVAGPAPRGAGIASARAVAGVTALKAEKKDAVAGWKQLAKSGSKIWLDGLRQPVLDVSVPQIGAPAAWAAGYTGVGTTVAVVDSGVDVTHPDLADRVAAQVDFTETDSLDHVGHGTHVASTIVGSGAASNGRYKGVAPGARLLSAKVCLEFGCLESDILEGMQWAAEQGADVVNISLGGRDTPDQDPVEALVDQLTADFGVLFVISAGNAGGAETVGSPASADSALAVGAVTKTDELANFSSRGPRVGDAAIKPEITAPGVDIVAANSKDGFLGTPGQPYTTLSGTSMAAPHVAGAAAILAQRQPDWGPARLKAALMGSAKRHADLDPYEQGAGRVDVARVINQVVTADPAAVSFGRQLWPHDDDQPVVRTVTYTNSGTTAVTLDLALDTASPVGMFTLSATQVTVPAGGTASVTFTADTRTGPDGNHTGYLVATGGATVVTPFAVHKEVESYDLTVNHIDRAGNPAEDVFTFILGLDNRFTYASFGGTQPLRVRVPKGRYTVISDFFNPETREATLMTDLIVPVDQARSITIDARQAKPVRVTIPADDVDQLTAGLGLFVVNEDESVGVGIGSGGISFDTVFSGQTEPNERYAGANSTIDGQWGAVDDEGVPVAGPEFFAVAYLERGFLPTGYQRQVRNRDFATIKADVASSGVPRVAQFTFASAPEGMFAGFSAALTPLTAPGRRTEHLASNGMQWSRELLEMSEAEEVVTVLVSPRATFEPGRTYHEARNYAVYGPAFPPRPAPPEWITRTGDFMVLDPWIHSDRANWAGFAPMEEGHLTLDRNGQRIVDIPASFGEAEVPPGDALYKLAITSTRGAPAVLSTKVSVTWTFRSDTVPGEQFVDWQPMPLSAVRFAPVLRNDNSAPAGTLYPVPVYVQPQPDSAAGPVRSLAVQVSYDDGATWAQAQVLRIGNVGVALLRHPAGAGFVSLRAQSADANGNTVEQEIIRAYRLR